MIDNIQWRRYKQNDVYFKDLDAVVRLHSETEDALGQQMFLPNLMDKPVLEAWVGERDGVVVGGFYCEAVVEPVFFGRDPVVSASARRFCAGVLQSLKDRGFLMVRMEVPRWIGRDAEAINQELEAVGFKSTDPDFHHYRYDLRRLAGSAGRNGRG